MSKKSCRRLIIRHLVVSSSLRIWISFINEIFKIFSITSWGGENGLLKN
jgi:hypothetical protein